MIVQQVFNGPIEFKCETCAESVQTGTRVFGDALKQIFAKAWVVRRASTGWKHFCGPCAKASS